MTSPPILTLTDYQKAAAYMDKEWDAFRACAALVYHVDWTPEVAQGIRYYIVPGLYACRVGVCGGEYVPTWITLDYEPVGSTPYLAHEWKHAYGITTETADVCSHGVS